MEFLNFLMRPLGQFLYFIYETLAFRNYGWTIIIFTVIVRVALLPLTFKQQKSSLEMQRVQPLIKEINERYKNDKEKLTAETMALYKEHNVNPVGSCLPTLFQLPIILALYQVISRPLHYLLNIDSVAITQIIDIIKKSIPNLGGYQEVAVIKNIADHVQEINTSFPFLGDKIQELQKGMNFYGLKLYDIPTTDYHTMFADPGTYIPILVLALVATVITFISSKLSIASMNKRNNLSNNLEATNNGKKKVNNKSNKPEKTSQMAMTNSMMLWLGPVMTLFISFQVPAGVTLYWATGYVIMIIQQLYINKKFYSIKEDKKANG
jgi:YidC/Oxa1 family membrane protein insertase